MVRVRAALSGEHVGLTLQMPSQISAGEVTRRVAEASGADPEDVSLVLDGSPLAGPLPEGKVELTLLRRNALAALKADLLNMTKCGCKS